MIKTYSQKNKSGYPDLNGKTTGILRCMCCDIVNRKQGILSKIDLKELKFYEKNIKTLTKLGL